MKSHVSSSAQMAHELVGNTVSQAQLHQLDLALAAGNHALAREMEDRWGPSQVIDLGDEPSLDRIFMANGGEAINPGTEYQFIAAHGIHRRLSAGLLSFNKRGLAFVTWGLSGSKDDSTFRAESEGGVWTQRTWRVMAKVGLPAGKLIVRDAAIAVRSSAMPDTWTGFAGRAISNSMHNRIDTYLKVDGFYKLRDDSLRPTEWEPTHLTENELDVYHDIHGGPVGAAIFHGKTGDVRVVLSDDDYRSAKINFGELCTDFRTWSNTARPEVEEEASASLLGLAFAQKV